MRRVGCLRASHMAELRDEKRAYPDEIGIPGPEDKGGKLTGRMY